MGLSATRTVPLHDQSSKSPRQPPLLLSNITSHLGIQRLFSPHLPVLNLAIQGGSFRPGSLPFSRTLVDSDLESVTRLPLWIEFNMLCF